MNRVTRMIYKARFKTRQRRALAFSHKYVITLADLTDNWVAEQAARYKRSTEIDDLISGFDPEKNAIDRHIFYEVTGNQLIEGEFRDQDTSDDEWERKNSIDPLARAFSFERPSQTSSELVDDETRVALIDDNRKSQYSPNNTMMYEKQTSGQKSPTTIN